MPLYIPWLTETIKKRGVRYLLHHYLGQFFEEKLTLEQLSIDIYEGKGSIRNLALDVNGLNDELDFIPFKFLDGCLIGQISVEVPWSSLATEACKVELEGAKFVCRLKTSADGSKTHCTESTLLSRSLMTSSMQMAEDIVTTEDDDDYESPTSSVYDQQQSTGQESPSMNRKKKDANQMFEGLEMFAQLIDSVLRRTKLTARNTLFQIQPHQERQTSNSTDSSEVDEDEDVKIDSEAGSDGAPSSGPYTSTGDCNKSTSGDEFVEPTTGGKSDGDDHDASAENTVEFLIKFFRCEEIIDQTWDNTGDGNKNSNFDERNSKQSQQQPLNTMPENITKLLTLEDVEMRIGGKPVSNLIGKHTIMIKFNGQKSEISIFSGSPLLAVIGHEQLKTFFNVFESTKDRGDESSPADEKNQKVMSPEDYAKIENQLLESASHLKSHHHHQSHLGGYIGGSSSNHMSSQSGGGGGGRRWVDSGDMFSNLSRPHAQSQSRDMYYDYHSPNSSSNATCNLDGIRASETEPSLDNIEAFSCELKLPGIWLCILRDGETLPPLIKPYADSMNSFQTINKYIDQHIKVPHIRFLALKVALDITAAGINVHLGDLDISEHLQDKNSMSPTLHLLHNDLSNCPMNSSRYKAFIMNNNKDITVDILTKTRILFDPTMIDRIVFDYKLIKLQNRPNNKSQRKINHHTNNIASSNHRNKNQLDLNLTIRGEQFKIELLCPIPDLTPEARFKQTQLRPQSFLFDFKNITISWQLDKLNISAQELLAYVKTQPKQSDNEAIKFIEAISKNNDKILLTLEPTPSNLDTAFPNDIEQALNESSMYDSIYVGQATESRLPTEAFQTKRKVVRASMQSAASSSSSNQSTGIKGTNESNKMNDCDNEKIIAPGDRQHLTDYLNQTIMCTKMSLSLHLPICEVEFEDKEQLDLIYNRFANDFVFWQPKAFSDQPPSGGGSLQPTSGRGSVSNERRKSLLKLRNGDLYGEETDDHDPYFKQPIDHGDDNYNSEADNSDQESENSFHSLSVDGSSSEFYDNQATCKVVVDELFVRFNHQSCAAALKQEISVENLLLGVVIDVNKKPGTVLSLVADNLELSSDLDTVLEGNCFGDKNSTFSMTVEIKRPTKSLKDIKLAIQLANGLFNDFKTETYTRFWQSINVTDEPILGFVAPKIVTELHIDVLNTALSIVRNGIRPALLSVDELYLTSMVMEQTSQVMIRLIADEVSLYLKRNKRGLEIMKNYICLIDSGLIDLDVKFSHDGKLEFGVINNVITVRACQDSLSALCKLFSVMFKKEAAAATTKSSSNTNTTQPTTDRKFSSSSLSSTSSSPASKPEPEVAGGISSRDGRRQRRDSDGGFASDSSSSSSTCLSGNLDSSSSSPSTNHHNQHHEKRGRGENHHNREMDLLEDAMNDFSVTPPSPLETPTITNHSQRLGAVDQVRCQAAGREVEQRELSEEDGSGISNIGGGRQRQQSSSSSSSNSTGESDDDDESPPTMQQITRNPNACLLDESNPVVGDFLSQPLLPNASSALKGEDEEAEFNCYPSDTFNAGSTAGIGLNSTSKNHQTQSAAAAAAAVNESGFFVIGNDDVGQGIIDKLQLEPVVRKLIDGPINIIENHFKMTKPRTIPEILANSLERYVLEEMTLVVNLYGGQDFDDEPTTSSAGTSATSTSAAASGAGSCSSEALVQDTISTACGTTSTSNDNDQTTTTSAQDTAELVLDNTSFDSVSMRSRAGSVASTRLSQHRSSLTSQQQQTNRKHYSSDSSSSMAFNQRRLRGARRKHLSEGSYNNAHSSLSSRQLNSNNIEQRVRFGDGAVNLWESLDLMSSPDFLGTNKRPNQPPLSSDLKLAGGTWRQTDVCIQLTLSKVKLLYEIAEEPTSGLANTNSNSSAPDGVGEGKNNNLSGPIAWRFMLFIHDIEIKDRIHASDINKMLYEYCTESMPRRNTQILTIKNVATINPTDGCEECDLRVSLKPLRLNIDQDTLLFLIEFFTSFSKSLAKQQAYLSSTSSAPSPSSSSTTAASSGRGTSSSSSSSGSSSRSRVAVSGATSSNRRGFTSGSSNIAPESGNSTPTTTTKRPNDAADLSSSGSSTRFSGGSGGNPKDRGVVVVDGGGSNEQRPIYIKSFTFSPDVPIRLDYHAKHLDFEQGALAGILMGLAHLDHSELILRRVQAKHGMRGLDRVLLFTLNSWLSDIKRNQLPSILGGVGPMHSVIQLFQGMRDLIWMPIDHYRKDRRLVRGLQRGASSFSSSTAMAAINLMNRFISIVQCTAQIAHDIVTPPSMMNIRQRELLASGRGGCKQIGCTLSHQDHSSYHSSTHHHHQQGSRSARRLRRLAHTQSQLSAGGSVGGNLTSGAGAGGGSGCDRAGLGLNQPRNFCEGVAVGFTILKEGFNDTARNVAVGMQADDVRSAMGELVRQIPSTLLNPIISATEGAQNVLVGIRNQIAPDARREDQEKWKRRVRGK